MGTANLMGNAPRAAIMVSETRVLATSQQAPSRLASCFFRITLQAPAVVVRPCLPCTLCASVWDAWTCQHNTALHASLAAGCRPCVSTHSH